MASSLPLLSKKRLSASTVGLSAKRAVSPMTGTKHDGDSHKDGEESRQVDGEDVLGDGEYGE